MAAEIWRNSTLVAHWRSAAYSSTTMDFRRVAIFFLLCATQFAQAAKPATQSAKRELRLAGLQQPVTVLRDRWGVSHIFAKNQHDLFFAQGYVAASDRLFQMELWKR